MSNFQPHLKPLPEEPLQLLHLGDSYTCAEGIPADSGWTALLRSDLERLGRHIARQQVIARTGWTVRELLEAVEAAALGPGWDFVTLCIGVNNQYRGLDPADYASDLRILVHTARACLRDTGQLLLLSIPDWGASPFASGRDPSRIAREIDACNRIVRQIAREQALPFLDWTPLSRQFARDPAAFAPDGLHPSATQHQAWATAVLSFLLESQT